MKPTRLMRRIDPNSEQTADEIAVRLFFWLIFIALCAIPAVTVALLLELHDLSAPLITIATFATFYTAISSTAGWARMMQFKAFRRAVYVTLVARLFVSIVVPVGMFFDLVAGMAASRFVPLRHQLSAHGFVENLLTSFAVAGFIQVIVLVFFAFAFVLAWMTIGWTNDIDDPSGHGFEVLPASPGDRRAVL